MPCRAKFYRIMFIHVPASMLSMFIYLVMAGYAALGLIFNTRLSAMMAQALAPTGALFAFISLWTGALWGKPMWGAWWVWDARLTSELILLFLYLGFIALHASIDDIAPRRPCRGIAGHRRLGERADHLFFGEMVEHPASGLDHQIQRHQHADRHAAGHVHDVGWPAGCMSIAVSLARVRSIILEREAQYGLGQRIAGGATQ